jgi:hypothetical protein
MTRKDFSAVIKLQQQTRALILPWTSGQLESHLRVFPEGQLVAVDDKGTVVGAVSALILAWKDEMAEKSWLDLTGHGYFHTHRNSGDTLYAAALTLAADEDRVLLRDAIYEALKQLVTERGLKRLLVAGRIPGFKDVASDMSPEDYVAHVVAGETEDPVLSQQLASGFRVIGVMPDYHQMDSNAGRYATLTAWSK